MSTEVSIYGKVFDCSNRNWRKLSGENLLFLRTIQFHCNQLLKIEGKLLLNDVYELLGFERVDDYNKVGWIYNENNPIGDNFVDFFMYGGNKDRNIDHSIILDFNVDGQIIY